jgi:hypothetical protein
MPPTVRVSKPASGTSRKNMHHMHVHRTRTALASFGLAASSRRRFPIRKTIQRLRLLPKQQEQSQNACSPQNILPAASLRRTTLIAPPPTTQKWAPSSSTTYTPAGKPLARPNPNHHTTPHHTLILSLRERLEKLQSSSPKMPLLTHFSPPGTSTKRSSAKNAASSSSASAKPAPPP